MIHRCGECAIDVDLAGSGMRLGTIVAEYPDGWQGFRMIWQALGVPDMIAYSLTNIHGNRRYKCHEE